jgi:hypothetical protein
VGVGYLPSWMLGFSRDEECVAFGGWAVEFWQADQAPSLRVVLR